MKKMIVFCSLFCFSTYAQETEKQWVIFRDYNLYYTSVIDVGNNMTQGSHRNYGGGLGFKLGIVEYKKVGFGLFYNYTKHTINDIAMIGDFQYTKYSNYGLVFTYRQDLNEKSVLKPEIGYYATDAKDKNSSEGRVANYGGNGFLVGADYLFYVTKNFALVGGIRYNYLRFSIDANSAYKNYFANAHGIQLKVGLHLGR